VTDDVEASTTGVGGGHTVDSPTQHGYAAGDDQLAVDRGPGATWPSPVRRPSYPTDRPTDQSPVAKRTEPYAIASLWCSIIGIVIVPSAVAGIVFGFIGRARIARSRDTSKGMPLVIIGIIIGFLAVGIWVVVLSTSTHPSSEVLVQNGPPADTAQAQRELIPADSYPPGWTGLGKSSAMQYANYWLTYTPQQVPAVEQCLGISVSHVDATPAEAADQTYADPNAIVNGTYVRWVSDTVDVFPSIEAAMADARAARSPNGLACTFRFWGQGLTGYLSPGFGPSERDAAPTVLTRTPPPVGGTASDEAWSMRYTFRGTRGTIFGDWVRVQSGRSVSTLWITNLGSPVSSAFITGMARAAEHQLAAG